MALCRKSFENIVEKSTIEVTIEVSWFRVDLNMPSIFLTKSLDRPLSYVEESSLLNISCSNDHRYEVL